jgi:hypothetical protein
LAAGWAFIAILLIDSSTCGRRQQCYAGIVILADPSCRGASPARPHREPIPLCKGSQRPESTLRTNTKEFRVPADEPILRCRQKLKEWEQRGWRIDTAELNRTRRQVACAIPGPERRNHKGWVLDTIPLVAPSRQGQSDLQLVAEQ